MGISEATLYNWKKDHLEILESLKKGKEVVDRLVENALLKRALGYEYTETKEKREGGVLTEVTTTVKEVVPDVTAQIFWLKNRKADKWRDKPESDTTEEFEDNFIDALNASAKEVWEDVEENDVVEENQ